VIRSDKEYREAMDRIARQEARLAAQEAQLKSMGLGAEEVKRALDPMRSFQEQLREEARTYERLKRGQFEEVLNLRGLGQVLVSLRIAQGLTQRQLAARLGVHETQVSRDERNEYHGVTLERAARILEALGVIVRSRVERAEEAGVA
jgi:DNA-directed RNA polymerase specialized sigma subunit